MDPKTTSVARLDELEARLALQDQSILELSDEIYRQQRQIAQLEATIGRLAQRLEAAMAPEPSNDPANEIPPHY